ncbi:MAG: hypothetical protein HOA57_04285 [Candidatus Magasanikbacteria bacterium]|jgi:hypothetical protein|nr:hypothetical protein [Candidatus Magasanikbacteria bacterium]MBT4314988.1 hypothetical protein [Candidatus Magasanikbacteria bacterium]MBT4546944.1 hypothetical protein [Candidatus Magasanikbacteria bacterium]MBT6819566.1 hypothetical protein [Candidatus Magasanikbacteria bacterium]
MFEKEPHAHDTIRKIEGGKLETSVDLDKQLCFLQKMVEDLEKREVLLKDEEIKTLISHIESNEESFLVMRILINRLMEETNSMHDWVENGLYFDLVNDDLGKEKIFGGHKVNWNSEDRIKSRGFSKGYFDVDDGEIYIEGQAPEYGDIVRSLAQKGRLPQKLRILGHELIHVLQHSEELKKIKRPPSIELDEVQANRFVNNPPDRKTPDELIRRVGRGSRERLVRSIELIDKLNAFGFDTEEVSEMVTKHSTWDEENKTYIELEDIIKRKQNELGLSDDNLEKLVEIDRLERRAERYRVIAIAQEELLRWKDKEVADDS